MERLKEFFEPEIIWFLIGLALLLMELALPGFIVFFFGVGAWVVAAVCLFADISLNTQLLIFIGASLVSLICLRKWIKGAFLGHSKAREDLREEMKEYIGERCVVKEAIRPGIGGKVELHGTDWKAEAPEQIEEGAVVEIVGKENITLKVKRT